MDTLGDLVAQARTGAPPAGLAVDALAILAGLPQDDAAAGIYATAALTFAVLGLERTLVTSGSGRSIADAVCQAGGVQP